MAISMASFCMSSFISALLMMTLLLGDAANDSFRSSEDCFKDTAEAPFLFKSSAIFTVSLSFCCLIFIYFFFFQQSVETDRLERNGEGVFPERKPKEKKKKKKRKRIALSLSLSPALSLFSLSLSQPIHCLLFFLTSGLRLVFNLICSLGWLSIFLSLRSNLLPNGKYWWSHKNPNFAQIVIFQYLIKNNYSKKIKFKF